MKRTSLNAILQGEKSCMLDIPSAKFNNDVKDRLLEFKCL